MRRLPLAVRQALMSLHGVTAAEVSFDDKRAIVRYRPAAVNAADMVRAVQESGFTARVIEDLPRSLSNTTPKGSEER